MSEYKGDRASLIKQIEQDAEQCAREGAKEMMAGRELNGFVWLVKLPMLSMLRYYVEKHRSAYESDLRGYEGERRWIMREVHPEQVRRMGRDFTFVPEPEAEPIMREALRGGHMPSGKTQALLLDAYKRAQQGQQVYLESPRGAIRMSPIDAKRPTCWATYKGACNACGSSIEPGQRIVRNRSGWEHEECPKVQVGVDPAKGDDQAMAIYGSKMRSNGELRVFGVEPLRPCPSPKSVPMVKNGRIEWVEP